MNVIDTPVRAYAHCRDSRCVGNDQQPVDAIKTTTEWTYADSGGDLPFVEKSSEHLRFADEQADAACPRCGAARELSAQQRPVYDALSGYSQRGLLDLKGLA